MEEEYFEMADNSQEEKRLWIDPRRRLTAVFAAVAVALLVLGLPPATQNSPFDSSRIKGQRNHQRSAATTELCD